MAIRSLQEMTEKFKGIVGNTDFSESDEVVEFLEDLTDTYADKNNGSDWESKYTELKRRYISRFGNNEIKDASKDDIEDVDENEKRVLSYDEIFKEV